MDFDNYACRILSLEEVWEGTIRFINKKIKQNRFQNKKGDMVMVTVGKCEFGQLSDKRYVHPDGIFSLPYGHKDLEEKGKRTNKH